MLLAILLAGCEAPPVEELRLVTLADADASGLALRELPGTVLQSLGLPYGLAVVQAAGAAERAGLRVGDVVYGVNRTRVRNFEEFSRLLGQRADGRIGLLVRRGRPTSTWRWTSASRVRPKGRPGRRLEILF